MAEQEKDLVGGRTDFGSLGMGDNAIESKALMLERARGKDTTSILDELISPKGIIQGLTTIGAGALGGTEAAAYMGLQQLSGAVGRSKKSEDKKEAGIHVAEAGFVSAQEAQHQRNVAILQQNPDRFTAAALLAAEGDPDEANKMVAKLLGTYVAGQENQDYVGAYQADVIFKENVAQANILISQLESIPTVEGRVDQLKLIDEKLGHTPLTDDEYTNMAQRGMTSAVLFQRLPYATMESSGAALTWLQDNPDDYTGAYLKLEDIEKVKSGGANAAAALKFQAEIDAEAEILKAVLDWQTLNPGEKMPDAREIIMASVDPDKIGIWLHGESMEDKIAFYQNDVLTPALLLDIAAKQTQYDETLRHEVLTRVITQEQADVMSDNFVSVTAAAYTKALEKNRKLSQVNLMVGGATDVMDTLYPDLLVEDAMYSTYLNQVHDEMQYEYAAVGGIPLHGFSAIDVVTAVSDKVSRNIAGRAFTQLGPHAIATVGHDGSLVHDKTEQLEDETTTVIPGFEPLPGREKEAGARARRANANSAFEAQKVANKKTALDAQDRVIDATKMINRKGLFDTIVDIGGWDMGADAVREQIIDLAIANSGGISSDREEARKIYAEADNVPDGKTVEGSAKIMVEHISDLLRARHSRRSISGNK